MCEHDECLPKPVSVTHKRCREEKQQSVCIAGTMLEFRVISGLVGQEDRGPQGVWGDGRGRFRVKGG